MPLLHAGSRPHPRPRHRAGGQHTGEDLPWLSEGGRKNDAYASEATPTVISGPIGEQIPASD